MGQHHIPDGGRDRKTAIVHLLWLSAITFLLFSNTLGNSLVWDDREFIHTWDKIRGIGNLPEILGGAVPPTHEGVFRPLRGVFYMIDYRLWGESTFWYRMQAILVHISCVALIYLLTVELLGSRPIALMSSLLFAAHPAHIESITFTASSIDTIGSIFFLASLLHYLRWRKNGGAMALSLSLALAFAAFLTDELTLPLPLIILLYELTLARPNDSRPMKAAPYAALAAAFLLIRVLLLHIGVRKGFLGGSAYLTFLAMVKSSFAYVQATVLPWGLNVDHVISAGMTSFTQSRDAVLAQSLFDPAVLGSLAALGLILYVAASSRKSNPQVTFAVGWFFLGLLPVSNILPQAALMRERYLYLPSYGFCILFAAAAYWAFARMRERRDVFGAAAVALLFSCFLLYSCAYTMERNREWKDEETLWRATVAANPESAYAHYNLGVSLSAGMRPRDAIAEYMAAVRLDPEYAQAYVNMGTEYDRLGDRDGAVAMYLKALEIDPKHYQANYDLGVKYQEMGRVDDAILSYGKSLAERPDFGPAHYNLGNIYLSQGRLEDALAQYLNATAINPRDTAALNNLGITYYELGRYADAAAEYRLAIDAEPNAPNTHTNLANALQMLGRQDEAAKERQAAEALARRPAQPA